MDDERTRRGVIWLLLLLGAMGVIALVVWLLLTLLPPASPPPSSSPRLPEPTLSPRSRRRPSSTRRCRRLRRPPRRRRARATSRSDGWPGWVNLLTPMTTARILDGKKLAETVRAEVRAGVDAFRASHGRVPGLDVVLVGDDPASAVYTRNKEKASSEVGHARQAPRACRASTTRGRARRARAELNDDPAIDGILVQLPLPEADRRAAHPRPRRPDARTSTASTP